MNSRKLSVIVLVAVLAAACGFAAYRSIRIHSAGRRADKILEDMKAVIPGLGEETGIQTGGGRDPLAVITVDEVDIAGCLEIPSLGIMAPVAGKGTDDTGLLIWEGGSPLNNDLRISGSRDGVLKDLAKAQPGERVVFTDTDGVRYVYKVTTQYHLKDWDKGENDLMISFETDKDTDFVLGCTAGE